METNETFSDASAVAGETTAEFAAHSLPSLVVGDDVIKGIVASPAGLSTTTVINEDGYWLDDNSHQRKKQGERIPIDKEAPVYFFKSSPRGVPFLLMTTRTFIQYRHVYQNGAYSRENRGFFELGSKTTKKWDFRNFDLKNINGVTVEWMIVEKIPGDHNAENTWTALQNVNVGKYSVKPDAKSLPVLVGENPAGKLGNGYANFGKISVTKVFEGGLRKWRSDVKATAGMEYCPVSTSVHHLQEDHSDLRLAMISSNMFFFDGDTPQPVEIERLKVLQEYLLNYRGVDRKLEGGIRIWNAKSQHAIVTSVTPEVFAQQLQDPAFVKAFVTAAIPHMSHDDFKDIGHKDMDGGLKLTKADIFTWRDNYIAKYILVQMLEIPNSVSDQKVLDAAIAGSVRGFKGFPAIQWVTARAMAVDLL